MPSRKPPNRFNRPSRGSAKTPRTDWNDVAGWYDEAVGDAGTEYQREVVLPGVIRMLAAQPEHRVLDIACGQGVLCRMLAEKGIDVTGVDMAAELIEAARQRATIPEPRAKPGAASTPASAKLPAAVPTYHLGDARDLGFLPGEFYDSAACVLAIQNINPLPPVFANVERVLKPGGRFVIAMMHPCFRVFQASHWGWDSEKQVQYRRVDHYLLPRKVPILTHPGQRDGTYTWSFHRPLETYIRGARNAGLLVDAMEEWTSHKQSQPGVRAMAENTSRKEIPLFMAIRCVKIALPG